MSNEQTPVMTEADLFALMGGLLGAASTAAADKAVAQEAVLQATELSLAAEKAMVRANELTQKAQASAKRLGAKVAEMAAVKTGLDNGSIRAASS